MHVLWVIQLLLHKRNFQGNPERARKNFLCRKKAILFNTISSLYCPKFTVRVNCTLWNRCEISAKLQNQHIIRISLVQLILRNCEISSVYCQNFHCSVDCAKLRNQFSLVTEFPLLIWFCEIGKLRNLFNMLSEFPLFSWFCKIAKSVQFTIRMSTVQLILRNCKISSVKYQNFHCSLVLWNCEISSVYYQNVHCSVKFCEIAKSVQYTIRVCIV